MIPQAATRPPRIAAHGLGRSGRGGSPYGRDDVCARAFPLHHHCRHGAPVPHHRGQHGGRRGLGLCDPGYDPRSRFQGEANAIMPYLMRLFGIVAGFSEPNTQTGS
jgi:hypothetical protein